MAVGGPDVQALPDNITVQPGSTAAAPVTTAINVGDIWCYSVDIEVPPGPGGQMGFYMTYANTQIVPWSQTPFFLVVDDFKHTFPVNAELGKGLAMVAYNTGYWPHTVYFRFLGVPIASYAAAQPQAPVAPVDLSALGQGGQ